MGMVRMVADALTKLSMAKNTRANDPANSAVTACASFPSALATRSQTELKNAP